MNTQNRYVFPRHATYPPGKPMQSKLCIYTKKILQLRYRHGFSFRKIVSYLFERFKMKVCQSTLISFIRVRRKRFKQALEFAVDSDFTEMKKSPSSVEQRTKQVAAAQKMEKEVAQKQSDVVHRNPKWIKPEGFMTVDDEMRDGL